jgi:ATP-dependent Zn protease
MEALPAPLLGLALLLVLVLFVLALSRRPPGARLTGATLLLAGLVVLVVAVGVWALFLQGPPETKEIPYGGSPGSFLGLVKAGTVSRVVQQGSRLTITHDRGNGTTEVVVSQVPSELTNLVADIAQACAEPGAVPDCVSKVEIAAEEPSQTGQLLTLLLTALLPVILIGSIFYFMTRQARHGGGSGGQPERRGTRERLEELETLRSKGLIAEDEYSAKRKKILKEL